MVMRSTEHLGLKKSNCAAKLLSRESVPSDPPRHFSIGIVHGFLMTPRNVLENQNRKQRAAVAPRALMKDLVRSIATTSSPVSATIAVQQSGIYVKVQLLRW